MMRRLRSERGSAVVTAVLCMTVMLGVGVATVAAVDVQQQQGTRERQSESRFNLSEGVLNAQAFNLARSWPAQATTSFPDCTGGVGGATPADKRCVDPSRLSPGFTAFEYDGATWTTIVRDNAGANATFYDDAVTPGGVAWDQNQDDKLWVRARSTVQGRTRTIVALVRLERLPITLPQKAVVAGRMEVGSNGQPDTIDTKGESAQPVGVAVRCANRTSDSCLSEPLRPGASKPQMVGAVDPVQYPDEPILPPESIAALEEQARASNTRYAGCPGSLPATGGTVVFIEQGNCTFNGNNVAFAKNNPGIIIVKTGSISFTGSFEVYGTIYALNQSTPPSSGNLVEITGSSEVYGAVFVDGPGGFKVQGHGARLSFREPRIVPPPATGTGTIVRSTWRELPGG